MRRASYIHFIFALILANTSFLSCTKVDNFSNQYNPGNKVRATVSGRVLDITGKPVIGAVVKAGTSSAITEVNGNFRMPYAPLYENSGYIEVSKSGFFKGSRTFKVNASTTNFVEVMLIPKSISGTFNSSSGGEISVNNGGKISFSANSIINESTGAAYSGTVAVSAFFLNPEDDNFNQYMPGDLRGINTSNEENILKSYGMMAVELNGASGEKLQIASGKTATISSPIPASMLANAPATIPLWYFDEAKGMWVEQGVATKQGNNYVGTVSHFSFWNCDIPAQFVVFSATFKDQNGVPIAHHRVTITSTVYGTRDGYTDSLGYISGFVPAGEILVMNLYSSTYSNICPINTLLLTQNIGPYNTNTDLGVVNVTVTDIATTVITGNVLNCQGQPLTNGYVQLHSGSTYINIIVNNGTFTASIPHCISPLNVYLKAFDFDNMQEGPEVMIQVNGASTNAGQLMACGSQISEFIYLTVNNANYLWMLPDSMSIGLGATMGPTYTRLLGLHTLIIPGAPTYPTRSVSLDFNGSSTGNYNLSSFIFYPASVSGIYSPAGITTTITQYDTVGGFISGNISGFCVYSINNTTVPISGSFRVKRYW